MMNKLLIKNGRILNPASNQDEICDILTEGNLIKKIGKNIEDNDATIIDAAGCYVTPGLIDIHVHLRDPGFEYKETLATGSKAAAAGGFTTILAMANTNPVIDSAKKVTLIHDRAKTESPIHVLQVGSLTKELKGIKLSDIKGMYEAGVPALSEDGKSVLYAELFREAMIEAKKYNLTVLDHCEDINMKGKGAMNADDKAKQLGLIGITNAVEDTIIARDILIAKETGTKLHICHCSTKDSVTMIELAKKDGLSVSGEVCPHHFTLTTDDIKTNDSNYKMAPPLRSKADVDALKNGLKNNIIDVISSDHAPHAPNEKGDDMAKAAFGIVGLETSVPLVITELVDKGILTPMQMAEKMSYNPAKIIGLDKGTLTEHKTADITIIDPNIEYTINKNTFITKGRNTPFDGKKVKGKVKYTICDGNIVYKS